MGVIEREASAPSVGENDRFVLRREKGWAGALRPHSLVGRRVTRLPLGDRLAIDAISLGENDVFLIARLDGPSDCWRRRRTGVRPLFRRSAWSARHAPVP